jgi:hypothetical protein
VTLELSEEVTRRARDAARRTGRHLEAVLAEWLERGAASEDTSPLVEGTDYPIFTPYRNEAAAQVLLDALGAAEAANRDADRHR